MENINFVNAKEMNRLNPDTFSVPTDEELSLLKKGDFVKVCVDNKERFWVRVTEICGDEITGDVNNDLVMVDSIQ